MSDKPETGRAEGRDYVTLYLKLCCCAGPQPSRDDPRSDEHGRECPYRLEVEGRVD